VRLIADFLASGDSFHMDEHGSQHAWVARLVISARELGGANPNWFAAPTPAHGFGRCDFMIPESRAFVL